MSTDTRFDPDDPDDAHEPPASPRTRVQGGGTGQNPTTRVQGADGEPTEPVPSDSGQPGLQDFPIWLRDRYTPIDTIGAGSEGVVWRARPVEADRADHRGGPGQDGAELAIKIYFPGRGSGGVDGKQNREIDEGLSVLLRRLTELGRVRSAPYVPVVHDHGFHTGDGRAWIAMELLGPSLSEVIAEGVDRGGLPAERVRELIGSLSAMLAFWQSEDGVNHNPLDLTPENIRFRDGAGVAEPVIVDFGGIRRLTATQFSAENAPYTAAYAPLEQVLGVNIRERAWYALGLILREAITGTQLFRDEKGKTLQDKYIQHQRMTRGDFAGFETGDRRLRDLIAGLLARDWTRRWGAEEVREWLRGRDPLVPGDHKAPVSERDYVLYRQNPYHGPRELAGVLHDAMRQGGFTDVTRWLAEAPEEELRLLRVWAGRTLETTWLDSLLEHFQAAFEHDSRTRPAENWLLNVAATGIVVAFAPEATPYYRGRRADAEGLARLAASNDSNDRAVFEQIMSSRTAAGPRRTERILAVLERHRCPHPGGCHDPDLGVCRRVARLGAVFDRVLTEARARAVLANERITEDPADPAGAAFRETVVNLALDTPRHGSYDSGLGWGTVFRGIRRLGPSRFLGPSWNRRTVLRAWRERTAEALAAAVLVNDQVRTERSQKRERSGTASWALRRTWSPRLWAAVFGGLAVAFAALAMRPDAPETLWGTLPFGVLLAGLIVFTGKHLRDTDGAWLTWVMWIPATYTLLGWLAEPGLVVGGPWNTFWWPAPMGIDAVLMAPVRLLLWPGEFLAPYLQGVFLVPFTAVFALLCLRIYRSIMLRARGDSPGFVSIWAAPPLHTRWWGGIGLAPSLGLFLFCAFTLTETVRVVAWSDSLDRPAREEGATVLTALPDNGWLIAAAAVIVAALIGVVPARRRFMLGLAVTAVFVLLGWRPDLVPWPGDMFTLFEASAAAIDEHLMQQTVSRGVWALLLGLISLGYIAKRS